MRVHPHQVLYAPHQFGPTRALALWGINLARSHANPLISNPLVITQQTWTKNTTTLHHSSAHHTVLNHSKSPWTHHARTKQVRNPPDHHDGSQPCLSCNKARFSACAEFKIPHQLAAILLLTGTAIFWHICAHKPHARQRMTWKQTTCHSSHSHDLVCRAGNTTWGQIAAMRAPGEPYFESQAAHFCMIHAFNAAMGLGYLRAGAALQHAQRLCDNLTAKLEGEPRLGRMYSSRNTGNISAPILKHYLKSYTADIYLPGSACQWRV